MKMLTATKIKEVPMLEETIMLLEYLDPHTPITCSEIARWTRKDTTLKQILMYIKHEQPNKCPNPEEWCPYFTRNYELEIVKKCVYCGAVELLYLLNIAQ